MLVWRAEGDNDFPGDGKLIKIVMFTKKLKEGEPHR